MHSYELHLHELGLDPDRNPARDVLMATRLESTVLEPYRAYAQVFLEVELMSMTSHGPQHLAIELTDNKQLLWGPIYYLTKKE
jgi:hypothetical protein